MLSHLRIPNILHFEKGKESSRIWVQESGTDANKQQVTSQYEMIFR